MLFHSTLRKELSRSFGATLIVLITVVLTMTLIRTLGQASRGGFAPSDVYLVMGYTVLAYTPTLLTMSLLIAIIATLSRMYRDSEMVIWFCSGKGISAMLAPLFRFALPIFLVVGTLAFFVLPWSNQRIEDLRFQYERRGDLERVELGRFQESSDGSRVFFVENNNSGQKKGSNVFIATTEKGKETITSARSGRIEVLPQGQFLMLNNGQRLESVVGTTELKVSEFEVYGTQVGKGDSGMKAHTAVNTLTTRELLVQSTPANLGELSWRLGLVLAAFNFVIVGMAVSKVNPRAYKSTNLVFALFTFVLYYNLLSLVQSWIVAERTGFTLSMVALHGGVFVLAGLWLAKNHNNWGWPKVTGRPPTAKHLSESRA